ncbi:MAG: hypothetical protein Q9213_000202 [Squamulea squamosa]
MTAVDRGFVPQWNTAPLFPPGDLNNTNMNSNTYLIRGSDLVIVVEPLKRPLGVRDTLVLLIESLFSATERINSGGREASEPVVVVTHKHGHVQLQAIGLHGLFTPFQVAQVLKGIANFGERAGFYESSMLVVQHGIGPIAKVYIR